MTLDQLFAVLRARWMVIAGFVVLGVVAAVILTIKQLPVYSASADLIITPNTPEIMQSGGNGVDGFYVKTQIDILSSDRVISRAAQRLELAKDPDIIKAFTDSDIKGTIDQYCVSVLRRSLTIFPSKDSRLVKVIYESPDPVFAAKAANAIANAFVDVNSDLIVTTARRAAEDFNKHATALRKQLNEAQQRLAKYRQENGLLSLGDQNDLGVTPLNNLSSELAAAQMAAIRAEGHRDAAVAALKSNRGAAASNVISSPLLEALEGEEGRALSQLQSLASHVGMEHPDYIEQKNRIGSIRAQINAERRRIAEGLAVNASMAMERVDALKQEIASETQKVLTARAGQDELNALVQEVDNAQRAYELILQRFSTAALNSKSEEPSVAILTVAVPPLKQPGLNFARNTVIGGLFGLLAGVVAAALRELSDLRIRTPEDIERWLGVPSLVEIPATYAATAGYQRGAPSLPGIQTYRIEDHSGSTDPGLKARS